MKLKFIYPLTASADIIFRQSSVSRDTINYEILATETQKSRHIFELD